MIRLNAGLRLKSVLWERNNYTVGDHYGYRGQVEKITVSVQEGQMNMVPWAEVEFEDGAIILFNCDQMIGCEVLIE